MLRFIRGLLLLVVLVSLLLIVSPLHAQVEPALLITKIDVQNFPDVKVYLRGENLGQGVNLSELPVTLSENGQEIAVADLSSEPQEVGTQTALLLDASGSVLDPGLTGEPRHLEVGNVTNRLVQLELLSQADWLAAYAPDLTGNISPIQAWTVDHQAVANQLYTYQPPNNVDLETLETPLFDLIFFALDRFDEPEVPENTAKRIVLFSDGITGSSDLKLDDAVNRAVAEKVPIHTVLLGRPKTEESRRNMNRIAKLTGGQAYQITSVEALDDLWYTLAEGGEQRVLTYRSKLKQPREVSVTLPDGVSFPADFPIIEIQPVEIKITAPTKVSKEAPEYNTPLEELEPKVINIQVEFSWVDGYPRNLTRVEYMIGSNTRTPSEEEPFDQISFPIGSLDQGDYTIRVIAIDELDIRSESLPVPFRVDVTRQPAPTPTPLPPTEPVYDVLGVTISQSEVNTLLIFVTLVLSALALIVALRKPTVRERVTEAFTKTLHTVTERFMLNKGQASKGREIKATLSVVDPGRASSLLPTINIYAGAITKIGRSSDFAEIVINDQRVSRLHCRIAEESDGNLRLYDEGGASGTYVNFDTLDIDGRLLQSGDLINVGPIQFKFYYQSDNNDNFKTVILRKNEEITEPYQPIASS